jgi:hypothetical protein
MLTARSRVDEEDDTEAEEKRFHQLEAAVQRLCDSMEHASATQRAQRTQCWP